MKIGDNIRNRRKALKLSQEYVADQMGVSRQAVSKWETNQSEPTASNLVELARLLDTTVSELVEPEKAAAPVTGKKKYYLRKNMEIIVIAFFSGSVIMLGIEPDDMGFQLFAAVIRMILACIMAFNVLRLPEEIRLKTAVKELLYCITVHCVMVWLTPVIGNVLTAVIVLILCELYLLKVRRKTIFRDDITEPRG